MDQVGKFVRAGSPGLSKIAIVIIVAALAVGIFVLSKFGPIYNEKWSFEDKLEETLGRLAQLEEEGLREDIQAYCDNHGMTYVDAWENCTVYGTPGKPGRIVCNYNREIRFPLVKNPYIYPVSAVGKRTTIPMGSN
jgi:hypothetical protein